MASSNTTSPDTQVTLKINFEGMTRRHKLPLRDMGPSTLEDRVRALLTLTQDDNVVLERYSDSAGSYITLDKQNVSIYKQLYRAAKAKQKLKLRVTKLSEEKKAPRPVSVEDVPEPSTPVAAPKVVEQPEAPAKQPLVDLSQDVEPKKELPTSDTGLDFEASILASLLRRHAKLNDEETPANADVPVSEGITARDQWFANNASGADSTTPGQPSPPTPPRLSWGSCPALVPSANFAVCCNSCDLTVPDAHYHCSTCDDGDFDLCQNCVDQGITCYGVDHWLIKRVVKNGQIVNSTTETIAPKKSKAKATEPAREATKVTELPQLLPELPERIFPVFSNALYSMRTCNCCVTELPEASFLHCTSCPDFDLCHACFEKDSHGHNPKHPFVPAVEGAHVPSHVQVKLAPGRNQSHNAICDGCDKYIAGVRHKCLDCPDWDYCADCVVNSKFVHPNHRFVPIYEPLEEVRSRAVSRSVHFGICCDGPLCARAHNAPTYITGIRYKCTVCHDTDFCANCEASPANLHNKTHPLVKFKTPVRHVTVTTTGERGDGQRMQQMGDRNIRRTTSRSTETTANTAIDAAQPVVEVKPAEPAAKEGVVEEKPAPVVEEPAESKTEIVEEVKAEIKEEVVEKPAPPVAEKPITEQDLAAVFVRDTVADGTVLPPNHVFEQTWVLRNDGEVAWPAGCSVKFVGGDYMGHVDSNHPAGISELVSASESTVCYAPLAPGQEFAFNVLLRTPAREGKIISYWRLTTKDGLKFGHRLWCDVSVQAPKPVVEEPKEEPKEVDAEMQSSNMIFPKLEKESPVSSIHEEIKSEAAPSSSSELGEFEECVVEGEWEASDDGFMTDEEYDILDASDEEFLEEQQRRLRK
ncbi:zz type zinc finger domain-containing protein [Colletotrichum sojae]|uniref:Zz type zinc finger domain-containing protein n=1 Tax=Colletotrichum sojae TaxID=2175907 RepID=A0A8H6JE63_9PEZI|nr:zz type zinc finger domain-containing protein [Colletotrichum sojae]